MSNVAERIDAREHLVQWLGQLAFMYNADLKAMPEKTLTESVGGVARPVNGLTADAVNMCRFTTALLKGEESPVMDEAAYEEIAKTMTDLPSIQATFNEAITGLTEALSAADDATLSKTITTPWQQEMSVFTLATIAVNHIWYHDGQLNLIQAINGDGEVHWMG